MRILVTGAAGGFGVPTVAELTRRGHTVVGLDLHASGDGKVVACDVTDDDSVRSAVAEAVGTLGGLDAVIHYAGIGDATDAGAMPGEVAREILEVNLLGPWRVTGAAMDTLLLSSRPRLVFVSSGLAYLPLPMTSAYAVSKRGISAYADALRVEYGGKLTVSTVYPGYVKTPIHDRAAKRGLSLGDVGIPEEQVSDVVETVVKATLTDRPRRDVGTTWSSDLALQVAKRAPRLIDKALISLTGRQVRAGEVHLDVPEARGLHQYAR